MKRRRKPCPPLPAQRRSLTEELDAGPNLLCSHQRTDTQIKLLVTFFSVKKSSFILKAHVLLDISAGDPNTLVVYWCTTFLESIEGFPTAPVGTAYFSFIAVAIRRLA